MDPNTIQDYVEPGVALSPEREPHGGRLRLPLNRRRSESRSPRNHDSDFRRDDEIRGSGQHLSPHHLPPTSGGSSPDSTKPMEVVNRDGSLSPGLRQQRDLNLEASPQRGAAGLPGGGAGTTTSSGPSTGMPRTTSSTNDPMNQTWHAGANSRGCSAFQTRDLFDGNGRPRVLYRPGTERYDQLDEPTKAKMDMYINGTADVLERTGVTGEFGPQHKLLPDQVKHWPGFRKQAEAVAAAHPGAVPGGPGAVPDHQRGRKRTKEQKIPYGGVQKIPKKTKLFKGLRKLAGYKAPDRKYTEWPEGGGAADPLTVREDELRAQGETVPEEWRVEDEEWRRLKWWKRKWNVERGLRSPTKLSDGKKPGPDGKSPDGKEAYSLWGQTVNEAAKVAEETPRSIHTFSPKVIFAPSPTLSFPVSRAWTHL